MMDIDDFFDRRDSIDNALDIAGDVELLSFVDIAIDRKENLGPDLAQAIKNCLWAELRAATCPDSTNACRGKHCYRGFRNVREISGHTITLAHAMI